MKTELRLFSSNVNTVLLYGCETCRATKKMIQRIQTFIKSCLRRLYGIRWPERIRNEEIWERAGEHPIEDQIRKRNWRWIGHTLRKPATSITRQALQWNPQGRRNRGGPRNSWRTDTEAELETMGSNWGAATKTAQNRVRWRSVVDGLCSEISNRPKLSKQVQTPRGAFDSYVAFDNRRYISMLLFVCFSHPRL